MTASSDDEVIVLDAKAEVFKPIPGFAGYDAGDRGSIRSPRGVILTPQKTNRGYWLVGMTDDSGKKRKVTVHRCVLLAHRGEPEPGEISRHLDDDKSHNWLVNLVWGTQPENELDKYRNGRPKPVPPKRAPSPCILCGGPRTGNAPRCRLCVEKLGKEAARLLRSGVTLEAAAEQLAYPSLTGLHTLAVKHGSYGRSWRQRVVVTLRARWGRKPRPVTHRNHPQADKTGEKPPCF